MTYTIRHPDGQYLVRTGNDYVWCWGSLALSHKIHHFECLRYAYAALKVAARHSKYTNQYVSLHRNDETTPFISMKCVGDINSVQSDILMKPLLV